MPPLKKCCPQSNAAKLTVIPLHLNKCNTNAAFSKEYKKIKHPKLNNVVVYKLLKNQ